MSIGAPSTPTTVGVWRASESPPGPHRGGDRAQALDAGLREGAPVVGMLRRWVLAAGRARTQYTPTAREEVAV